MRILSANPRLVLASRGKSTTVLILREKGGQTIELVFTSLRSLGDLADCIGDAVTLLEDSPAGTSWTHPEQHEKNEMESRLLIGYDSLREAGVIESPGFLANPSPFRRRGQGSVSRPQRPTISTTPPAPATSPRPGASVSRGGPISPPDGS